MIGNLLHLETSPYLLQHRHNPVHWQPWGAPALALAAQLDRPILLSSGYAACHWCHVMAHESFEDPATAALMNDNFISIKLDREERPDLDRLYMQALQALGEQGGWPLTMFLTPDGAPFWGGTYFPPESRYGRPGFRHVLAEISRIWRTERHKATTNGTALIDALRAPAAHSRPGELSPGTLDKAAAALLRAVDREHGGLQGAPKFPQSPLFTFLWTMARRGGAPDLADAVATTLHHLCQGGIYDHLGGGIARYSVDARWLVPHFEKMLYDNAQFIALAARVWAVRRDDLLRLRIAETVTFVLRDMTTPEGAFAASHDADSEGEEGRYYVWTRDQVRGLLDPADAEFFCAVYDVTADGNWEGHAILNRLDTMELLEPAQESRLAALRARLLAERSKRIPPGFDDKVLADWNGLMIAALAEAALVFAEPAWKTAAQRAFAAVMGALWDGERLRHSWRSGQVRHLATADGYANLIAAALALHTLTASPSYLAQARLLAAALDRFHADPAGGYVFSSSDATDLLVRQRSAQDDATPNANGIMLGNLTRLHALTGEAGYLRAAEAIPAAFAGEALASPFAHPSLLDGFATFTDHVQAVLTGPLADPATHPLLRPLIDRLGPALTVIYVPDARDLPAGHPALAKASASAEPRLYLCRAQVCAAPAATPADVDLALSVLGLA